MMCDWVATHCLLFSNTKWQAWHAVCRTFVKMNRARQQIPGSKHGMSAPTQCLHLPSAGLH